jgi:glycosyltransferase 2 family protein
LLSSLLISLPFTLNLILVQVTIAWALGVHLPFRIFALFVPIIAIINLLPITFNGLGLREGIYTFLFVPIGVPAATAVSMSLAFYFLRFSAGLLGGLMYAFRSILSFARPPEPGKL